jgi:hypothetical protein
MAGATTSTALAGEIISWSWAEIESHTKTSLQKGKVKDDFKNHSKSKDIWKVRSNGYDQPALFMEFHHPFAQTFPAKRVQNRAGP